MGLQCRLSPPTFGIALLFLLAISAPPAFSQSDDPYVLRIAHEDVSGFSCVLLDGDGSFHFEQRAESNTKVYEGELAPEELQGVLRDVQQVSSLSQRDIEEPLIRGSHDLLDIHFFEAHELRSLRFGSSESQEPYRKLLRPLVRWMDGLHKLPHQELSEAEGKRNCLPRHAVVLKKRDEVSARPAERATRPVGRGNAVTSIPPGAVAPNQPKAVLRVRYFRKDSSEASESCLLVAEDRRYLFERRRQQIGRKKVSAESANGAITPSEFDSLREILDSRRLAGIRHHEPPGGMEPRIMGSLLELAIDRPTGVQSLVLTDTMHRTTFYYPGDGDIGDADKVLRFMREHIEMHSAPANGQSELNGCSELP